MIVVGSVKKMQLTSRHLAAEGKKIGLVPTMGFLHEGHLSLIRRAKKEADVVIVSIFVNPTQFAPNEDFERYPRDERGDIRKIKAAGGDIVFIPKAKQIYPEGFQSYVTVEKLSQPLEGAIRPRHFTGVATIVAKLYNLTRPDVVVFGMKDYQQAAVLRQMTEDLGYPIKFIVAPTVREKDGLAMSSRNRYLGQTARKEALCLSYALRTARQLARAGVINSSQIRKEMMAVISATCRTAKVDYIAFTELRTLHPVKSVGRDTVVSLAVRVQGVRLIDNLKLR